MAADILGMAQNGGSWMKTTKFSNRKLLRAQALVLVSMLIAAGSIAMTPAVLAANNSGNEPELTEPHAIIGYLYDDVGPVIPGVTVTVTNAHTGETFTDITDSTGRYDVDIAGALEYYVGDFIYATTPEPNQGYNSLYVDVTFPYQWLNITVDRTDPVIGATTVDKLFINNQGTFGGTIPPVNITVADITSDNPLGAAAWGIRDEFQWEGTMYFTCDITNEAMPATYAWDGSMYLIGGVLVTVTISPFNAGTDLFVFGEVDGTSAPGDEIGNTLPIHYATFQSDGTFQSVYSTEGTLDYTDDVEIIPMGGMTFRPYRYDEGSGYIATAALETYTVDPWVTLTIAPVPDGRYAVCVTAADEAGNAAWTNETTGNPVITVDNFAPTATATGPDTSDVYAFNVEYSYVADPLPSSGILNVTLFYNLNGAGWMTYGIDPTPMDGVFPVDLTAFGDGSYEWCLIAFDNTENREDATIVTEFTTLVDTLAPTIGVTLADLLFINNDPLNTYGGTMPPVTISTEVWDDNIAAAGWGIRDELSWEGTIYFGCDITDDVEDNAMPAIYTWDGNMYLMDGEIVTAAVSPYSWGTDLYVYGEINGASLPGDIIGNVLPDYYADFDEFGNYQTMYSTEGTVDRGDDIEFTPVGGETFRAYRYDEGAGYVATAAISTFTIDPWVTLTIAPVPDGRYAVCVSAIDQPGNRAWTNETTPNPVITVDNFAPTATATGPDVSNVFIFDVTYNWIDDPLPSSGILNVTLFYDRESAGWMTYGTDPTPMDGAFPVDLTAFGDGFYEWCLVAFDNTDNREDLVIDTEDMTLVDTAAPTIGATLANPLYINNQGTFGGTPPPVTVSTEVWDDYIAAAGWGVRDELQWEGTLYFVCDITDDVENNIMPAVYTWDGNMYLIDGAIVTATVSPYTWGTDLFVSGEVNGASAPGDELGNILPTHYATFLGDGTYQAVYSTEGTPDFVDDIVVAPVGGDTFRAYRYDEGTGYVATAALSIYTLDPWVALTISPVPDGRYAICVTATDLAQNAAWTNETTPNPVITVDNYPAYANATGPATSNSYIFDVTYSWVADPIPSSGLLNVSLWYNNGAGWFWLAEDPTPMDGAFPVDLTLLGDGTYDWFIAAFDMTLNHEDLVFFAEATTVVDATSPYVVTTTPLNGAIDVPLAAGTYVIEFSEPMDTLFGTAVSDLPGLTWTWSANGMWLNGTYTDLIESTTYNIDLSAGGFLDILGNPLIAGVYGWTFAFTTIGIPPEVVTSTPLNGAIDVAQAAGTYAIQFNEPMDTGVGTVMADLPLTSAWTWDGTGMWLNATYDTLTESTTYNIDLSTGGFQDVYGNALVIGAYGWTFTFTTIGAPPTILSTTPFDGETSVALNQNIVITFSETINVATITYTCSPDPAGWTEIWSGTDTILTLTHADFIAFGTYTFTVTYAEDLYGNALVAGASPNPWTFETIGTFNLDYSAGWNLFGIPVLNPTVGGVPLQSAYNITQAGALMVSKWTFATQRYTNFIAGFHLPGEPQDFALLPDEAYWAWMPAAGTILIEGQNPGPRNVAVDGPGWNMIAYMSLAVGDVGTDWAPFVSCGGYDDIARYDAGTFTHYIFATDIVELTPGRGYFVWSDAPANIPYTGMLPGPIQNANSGSTYWTIQDAINGASPYDTINVDSGTYNENIIIDRPLTLQGAGSGITSFHGGDDIRVVVQETTTIQGVTKGRANPWSGNTVTILSDDVQISGFVVSGSGTGTMDAGVYLYNVQNCLITDVMCTGNQNGFVLDGSSNNELTANEASGNNVRGFLLSNSNVNFLIGNNAYYNQADIYGTGIYLAYSSGNTIDSNDAQGNHYGIWLEFSDNNGIINNIASNNIDCGIYLYTSSVNTLLFNTGENNYYGFVFHTCNGNMIFNNYIMSNYYLGFYLEMYSSSGNIVTNNNFIGNPYQAQDDNFMGGNMWDMNFWSDWSGSGPYFIPDNSWDNNPSLSPWP